MVVPPFGGGAVRIFLDGFGFGSLGFFLLGGGGSMGKVKRNF